MKVSDRVTVSPANTSREALKVLFGAMLVPTPERVPSLTLRSTWSRGMALTHVLVSSTVARLRPLRNVQVRLTGSDGMVTVTLVPSAVVWSEHTTPDV